MDVTYLDTLFKYAKSGAIQSWTIAISDNPPGYEVTYGQVGGAKQTTFVETEGKNLGKANATTALEQAHSEALSKWKAQQDKGYSPGAPKPLPATSPMLAHSYEDHAEKISFPCYYQPKLDGIRCIAHRDGDDIILLSRKGKVFDTLDHLEERLLDLLAPGEIFDGELYLHGTAFQSITSWVKRKQDNTSKIEYHVYDMVSDQPFWKRYATILDRLSHNRVIPVHTGIVDSHKDVTKALEVCESLDYEGIMLRHGDCTYQCGRRSSELLKVKQFKDEDFVIVGAEENKGKQKGQCTFICKTADGKEFKAKPMGTDEQRREYWRKRDSLVGKLLTVRYFELTEGGIPRFPVGVEVRDYE